MRTCTKCGTEKPLDAFSQDQRYRDGYVRICKACRNAYVRGRRENDPEFAEYDNARRRAWHTQHYRAVRYGITTIEFFDMFVAQGRACKLCDGKEARAGRPDEWCVDHDHETQRVRGILCHDCNMSLGHFESMLKQIGEARLRDYLEPAPP